MVRWFERPLVMMPMTSGGAPALGMAPVAAMTTGGPPPSRNSARDTVNKWGNGGGSALFLQWGKSTEGALFGFLYRGESPGARGEMPQNTLTK
jgi:hypothetical protein